VLTNTGGRNATSAYITDSNSTSSPYSLGNLVAGENQQRSYLISLPRTNQVLTYTLSLATANATDSLSQNVIQAVSSQIQVIVPATTSAAALMLDKIVNLHNMTNDSISYNITLKLTNKGTSDASSSNITDTDSNDSPYSIGTIDALQTISRSYIKSYARNTTTYQVGLALARSQAIDSLTSTGIDANSTQMNITVPSTQEGQQITLIKNAYFNSENTTTVNYTISLQLINSGGVNLNSITLLDSDLGLNTLIDLNTTALYNYSSSMILEKEATNREQLFVKSTATVNTITYESNQIRISIPGYGGPADTIVYAPEFVNASTSFDTIISIINQNPDMGQNFIVDYWITNASENVVEWVMNN
jgi:hypothetical protein